MTRKRTRVLAGMAAVAALGAGLTIGSPAGADTAYQFEWDTECVTSSITVHAGGLLGVIASGGGSSGGGGPVFHIEGYCGDYELGAATPTDADTTVNWMSWDPAGPAPLDSINGNVAESVSRNEQWQEYRDSLQDTHDAVVIAYGSPDPTTNPGYYADVHELADNLVAEIDALNWGMNQGLPTNLKANQEYISFWATVGQGQYLYRGPATLRNGSDVLDDMTSYWGGYYWDLNGSVTGEWVSEGVGAAGPDGFLGAGCASGTAAAVQGVATAGRYEADWRATAASGCALVGGTSEGGVLALTGLSIEYIAKIVEGTAGVDGE